MLRSLLFLTLICGLNVIAGAAQQPEQASDKVLNGGVKPQPPIAPSPVRQTEDWAALPVDRKVLKPLLNGVPLGKQDFSGYSRELVRMEWRHGDPIDMYIVKPQNVEKPRVVLYLYGYPSDTDRFMNDGWCKRATSQGLAAVGFVSALTGDRFRNRPMKQWFVSELQESLGSSVHDVQLIVDYLAERNDLSAVQVGMYGQGSGASIAILAAAADSRIGALDLLNPWGDWPDWLKASPVVPDEERALYLTPEFLRKVSMLDPVTYLPRLSGRAYRVQQILDDPDTPSVAMKKIASLVPREDLVQFKDMSAHREAWKSAGLSGWLSAQLLPTNKNGDARNVRGQNQPSPTPAQQLN